MTQFPLLFLIWLLSANIWINEDLSPLQMITGGGWAWGLIWSDRADDATRKPFLPLSKLLSSVLTPFWGKHSHRARADKAEQQLRLKSLPAQPLQLKWTTFPIAKVGVTFIGVFWGGRVCSPMKREASCSAEFTKWGHMLDWPNSKTNQQMTTIELTFIT